MFFRFLYLHDPVNTHAPMAFSLIMDQIGNTLQRLNQLPIVVSRIWIWKCPTWTYWLCSVYLLKHTLGWQRPNHGESGTRFELCCSFFSRKYYMQDLPNPRDAAWHYFTAVLYDRSFGIQFHSSLGRVACLKAETYLAKKSDPAAATTALDGLLSGLAVVAEKAAVAVAHTLGANSTG